MHEGMRKQLKLDPRMPVNRYQPPPNVEAVPGQSVPFLDKAGSPEQAIQEEWKARVKIFDLGDETELDEYEKVWQRACNGHARICEHRTEFVAEKGKFVAFLRWADLSYKVPTAQ